MTSPHVREHRAAARRAGLRYLYWQLASGLLIAAGAWLRFEATGSTAFANLSLADRLDAIEERLDAMPMLGEAVGRLELPSDAPGSTSEVAAPRKRAHS